MSSSRQLVAIMFTDIQGYTALMQKDEQEALQVRQRHRQVFETTTLKHHGRILQYYGDGTLSIFYSVVEAVKCGIEMQQQFQKPPLVPLRIGIHMGDVILSDDEIIGDAVNVAARIEAIAVVGSVLVSDRVQMEIKNHDIQKQSLGHFSFKNVKQPLEIYAIIGEGLVVPKTHQMMNKGRVEDEPSHNLPQPVTQFFGRVQEMQQVRGLLSHKRLVTLLGPGGCGKSRLAIETARQASDLFPEGIWFIGLASVTHSEMVSGSLAEILKIQPEKEVSIEKTIAHRISNKRLLLVVDNCEHLIDEVANLMDFLIRATRQPVILATSRETLNIPSETIFQVTPLPVPELTAEVEEMLSTDSVRLFHDRVLLNKPDFQLDDANAGAVSEICQKLEGIPLALEMAASRIKMMDPKTILTHLSDQFRLLGQNQRFAPRHQQTMRATIDWSYDLLSNDERILFNRLSIFAGDLDLEGAERVCGFDPLTQVQILDLLTGLVDKSLVTTINKFGTNRYILLEVMKQYGKEKVALDNESYTLEQCYQNYYLDQASLAFKERMRLGDKWSAWFGKELPNLIAVINLLANKPKERLRLAGLLGEVLFMHANFGTGQKILTTALAGVKERNLDRARALCGLGFIEILIDPEAGYEKIKESISIISEIGDEQAKLDTYWRYGSFIGIYKEWEQSKKFLEEGLKIARKRGDPWMVLRYKNNLAWSAVNQRKPELIEDQIESNIDEALRLGNSYDIIDAYHVSADVAFLKKNFQLAVHNYIKAMKSALSLGSDLQVAVILHSLAQSEAGWGRHEKGLLLYGAANAKLQALEAVIPDFDTVVGRIESTIGKSQEFLGPEKSKSLDMQGRQMGFTAAIEYAFEVEKD